MNDLTSKRVAWVDRESSSGYYVPRLFLQGAGLDPTRLFAEEHFAGSHSSVVTAVLGGRVDLGATYCALGTGARESGGFAKVDPGGPAPPLPRGSWTKEGAPQPPLRVLAMTGAIPNDALVVATSVPSELRLSLLRWLLNLGPGRALQLCGELFGADAFQVSSPAHFDPLRRLVARSRR
jgi:phosphonate transport system substrate-binding protein